MTCTQVYKLPQILYRGGERCLQHERPPWSTLSFLVTTFLTQVATTSRWALANALTTKFFARVWDEEVPDPSFFTDAAVVLLPLFHPAKNFEMARL